MPRLDYTPSYDFGVPNPGADDSPQEHDGSNVPMTPAPATSHCYGFKLFAADPGTFLARFPSRFGRGFSEVWVWFRNKSGGIAAVYAYGFSTPAAARVLFDKLTTSGHPYSEVVVPYLIRTGTVYTAISRGA